MNWLFTPLVVCIEPLGLYLSVSNGPISGARIVGGEGHEPADFESDERSGNLQVLNNADMVDSNGDGYKVYPNPLVIAVLGIVLAGEAYGSSCHDVNGPD